MVCVTARAHARRWCGVRRVSAVARASMLAPCGVTVEPCPAKYMAAAKATRAAIIVRLVGTRFTGGWGGPAESVVTLSMRSSSLRREVDAEDRVEAEREEQGMRGARLGSGGALGGARRSGKRRSGTHLERKRCSARALSQQRSTIRSRVPEPEIGRQ